MTHAIFCYDEQSWYSDFYFYLLQLQTTVTTRTGRRSRASCNSVANSSADYIAA